MNFIKTVLDNLTRMLKSTAAAMDMVLEYKNPSDHYSPTKIEKSEDSPQSLVLHSLPNVLLY